MTRQIFMSRLFTLFPHTDGPCTTDRRICDCFPCPLEYPCHVEDHPQNRLHTNSYCSTSRYLSLEFYYVRTDPA